MSERLFTDPFHEIIVIIIPCIDIRGDFGINFEAVIFITL